MNQSVDLAFWPHTRLTKFIADITSKLDEIRCPEYILTAKCDYFCYACGLKSGTVFVFSDLKFIGNGWVRLNGISTKNRDDMIFDRGVEVRLSEISWVADAPYGS